MDPADEFEKWYDTYERNGEELLLFNSYDMEAAFLAGAKSTTPQEPT